MRVTKQTEAQAPRAVIYARISLDATGERAGVERQRETCAALAERRGWEVVEIVEDNSVSAKAERSRPGWSRVLQMVENGAVEYVVAYHFDRVTRSMVDLEDLIKLAETHNIGIAFAEGDLDLTTASGRLNARILAAVGYEIVTGEGGKRTLAINADEAEILRRCYSDALAGVPLHAITRDLNDRGVPTTLGNAWRTASLRQLLLNPRNIARVTDGGEEQRGVAADWPPLIDTDSFRRLARMLAAPGRRPSASTRRKGLLTGVLHCGHVDAEGIVCDARMGLASQVQQGRTYRYYACRTGHNSWPVDWLDAHVRETVLASLKAPAPPVSPTAAADLEALEADRGRLERLLEELLDDRMEGVLTRPQWRERDAEAKQRLAQVQEQIDRATVTPSPLAGYNRREQLALWEEMDADRQRAVILTTFGEIHAAPRGRGLRAEPDRRLLTFERGDVLNKAGIVMVPTTEGQDTE